MKKIFLIFVLGFVSLGGTYFILRHPSTQKLSVGPDQMGKIFEVLKEPFESVQSKIEKIARVQKANAKLKLENTQLLHRLAARDFECRAQTAQKMTQSYEMKLDQETGSRVGRTIASMSYRVPEALTPPQVYALAIRYLRRNDPEKAAVLLSWVTGLEQTDTFKTPKNYLLTGFAWFRLDNYILADFYFDQVLKKTGRENSLPYHAQARLWKAIIGKKLNKEFKSQYWMKELVDFHPLSQEASWVNPQEGKHEKNHTHD